MLSMSACKQCDCIQHDLNDPVCSAHVSSHQHCSGLHDVVLQYNEIQCMSYEVALLQGCNVLGSSGDIRWQLVVSKAHCYKG